MNSNCEILWQMNKIIQTHKIIITNTFYGRHAYLLNIFIFLKIPSSSPFSSRCLTEPGNGVKVSSRLFTIRAPHPEQECTAQYCLESKKLLQIFPKVSATIPTTAKVRIVILEDMSPHQKVYHTRK